MDEKVNPSINIFPVDKGVCINVVDDNNTNTQIVLSPDDAGRMAFSLLSTSILFNFLRLQKLAEAEAEVNAVRQNIESGKKIVNPNEIFKKR